MSSKKRNHDIKTKKGLTALSNTKVVSSEEVKRPFPKTKKGYEELCIFAPDKGRFSSKGDYGCNHSGVVVTTENNQKYLIHKGKEFGGSGGNTVAVDARHMSSKWEPIPGSSHSVSNSTVSDFVGAGGTGYNLFTDNCHKGRHRMNNLD